ncbi:MAG: adenosylmethionine decarboxylase [Alphaproteobacteria bacterium]|nr:adenosylmethionine decarboxylase [Alphaproteobacteria bacterium]
MKSRNSLAQMGMDLAAEHGDVQAKAQADIAVAKRGHLKVVEERQDHFVERDGVVFAGTHLIVDLWGAKRLDDLAWIEQALKDAVKAAKATLLHIHLHHFEPNGGVSGVAVLAESHISIHTWPERGYAALDIFMCGVAKPHKAIPVLRRAFSPDQVLLSEQKRGMVG